MADTPPAAPTAAPASPVDVAVKRMNTIWEEVKPKYEGKAGFNVFFFKDKIDGIKVALTSADEKIRAQALAQAQALTFTEDSIKVTYPSDKPLAVTGGTVVKPVQ